MQLTLRKKLEFFWKLDMHNMSKKLINQEALNWCGGTHPKKGGWIDGPERKSPKIKYCEAIFLFC